MRWCVRHRLSLSPAFDILFLRLFGRLIRKRAISQQGGFQLSRATAGTA